MFTVYVLLRFLVLFSSRRRFGVLAHAWKACVRLRVPWVRIPLSPHLNYTHPEGWQSLAECTGLENQQGFIPFGGSA
jgi:hypothetical protein